MIENLLTLHYIVGTKGTTLMIQEISLEVGSHGPIQSLVTLYCIWIENIPIYCKDHLYQKIQPTVALMLLVFNSTNS